jgi:dethiobiotin synthetase
VSPRLVVTGTDTGVGKTVFAAALTGALRGGYWKPIQSGLEEETDSETVLRLSGVTPGNIFQEAWRLKTPASPHRAAEIDGVSIIPDALSPPETTLPLIIEGAGGLLVPLTHQQTFADVFARWQFPVILCARTVLGTINHTLLSLEAMRQRRIPIMGVAFIGDAQPDSERVIEEMSGARRLGRLPRMDPLTPDALCQSFRENFDMSHFAELPA